MSTQELYSLLHLRKSCGANLKASQCEIHLESRLTQKTPKKWSKQKDKSTKKNNLMLFIIYSEILHCKYIHFFLHWKGNEM